jgi:hypothetical protein
VTTSSPLPHVLPMRQRADVINRLLKRRLTEILPDAMRAAGIDCWLILCQEDNLDPVYTTMIPMDTWCPILQILVFVDNGDRVEGFNISGTNTHDLYLRPYGGQSEAEQWTHLLRIIESHDPRRIGINIGEVQWAAGGLTHNLYRRLTERLPTTYVERLVSAEPLAIRWLTTLTEDDLLMYQHVCAVAHGVIAECYSRQSIIPGHTSIDDLPWTYWQRCADLGFAMAFKPYFRLVRSTAAQERYGPEDRVIRPGDLIHCDVGLQYLRFNSDHQQIAYVLRPDETAAPVGLTGLMMEANRLQDIYMGEFREGLSGNDLLANVLNRARREGVPNPRVYSHSVGLFVHEPGPLIGLPWEQDRCPGRGDVTIGANSCFTMELSVTGAVPEWEGDEVRFPVEEVVAFTPAGCRPLDRRQTELYLI